MVQPDRDPAELVVDVVALLRRAGERLAVQVDHRPDDLASSVAIVERITSALTVESTDEAVVVTGDLAATWTGECRRCLDATTATTLISIKEVFEREPVEGETYALGDETIDLEPMLREQVLLAMPLAPLCADECSGPDPGRYRTVVASDVDLAVSGDPRWAALDELRFDD